MLCDQCFLRNAAIHITNIRDCAMTTRHLCQECAAEEPFNLINLSDSMKGLVFLIEGSSKETKQKTLPKQQKDLTCGQCRYRLSDFRKTQKVGCPACYEAFREALKTDNPIKTKEISPLPLPRELALTPPGHDDTVPDQARDWELLQGKLYQALKTENYEEAAKIRDQLRLNLGSPH